MSDLRLSSLTLIGFEVNVLLERHPGEMQFHEIYRIIDDRSFFEDLAKRYPDETDFSLFGPGDSQRELVLDALRDAASALEGREHRKVGIEGSGLNLLIALILEAIQQNRT